MKLELKTLAHACFKNSGLIDISTILFLMEQQNYLTPKKIIIQYLYTKQKDGELAIISNLPQHFIIRTSWLYSEFGNNFVKTMLRLSKEREELSVVDGSMGSPTYAKDLAEVIFKIISSQSNNFEYIIIQTKEKSLGMI